MLGKISAIGALAMGVLFAVNAYFQFATGVSGWLYVGVALALLSGGVRTLGKMSGGLRLLAGAWGFVAGLLSLDLRQAPPLPPGAFAHDTYAVTTPYSWLPVAFVAIALLGLALAILHKESKPQANASTG